VNRRYSKGPWQNAPFFLALLLFEVVGCHGPARVPRSLIRSYDITVPVEQRVALAAQAAASDSQWRAFLDLRLIELGEGETVRLLEDLRVTNLVPETSYAAFAGLRWQAWQEEVGHLISDWRQADPSNSLPLYLEACIAIQEDRPTTHVIDLLNEANSLGPPVSRPLYAKLLSPEYGMELAQVDLDRATSEAALDYGFLLNSVTRCISRFSGSKVQVARVNHLREDTWTIANAGIRIASAPPVSLGGLTAGLALMASGCHAYVRGSGGELAELIRQSGFSSRWDKTLQEMGTDLPEEPSVELSAEQDMVRRYLRRFEAEVKMLYAIRLTNETDRATAP